MKTSSPETLTLTLRVTLRLEGGRWRASAAVLEPNHDGWPDDPADFGQAVRVARVREGISQAEFSSVVGLEPATLRNVEAARHPPKPNHRAWIVKALAKLGIPPPASVDSPTQQGPTEEKP